MKDTQSPAPVLLLAALVPPCSAYDLDESLSGSSAALRPRPVQYPSRHGNAGRDGSIGAGVVEIDSTF